MGDTKMKIAIIGGGAVGLTYAAFLAPVAKIIVKTHEKAQAESISRDGIQLTLVGEIEEINDVSASSVFESIRDCDAVIIALKSYNTEPVAKELSNVIGSDVPIISLQNGLQAVDTLKRVIANPGRIFAGITYIGAKRTDYRSVKLGQNRRTVIDAKAGPILDVFIRSRFGVERSDNIQQAIWDKMVLNNGQNALSAVTNLSVQQMLASPECLHMASELLAELKAVGEAEGITFDYSLIEKLKSNWSDGSDFYPSMWQDLHAGRKTEIDAINGAICKLGEKHNIATPYNGIITQLIKVFEKQGKVAP